MQRGKEGQRWKGVPAPQDADGRAGYRMAARTTGRHAVITSSGRLWLRSDPPPQLAGGQPAEPHFIHRRQRRELTVLPRWRRSAGL